MLKYKDTYFVIKQKDKNGIYTDKEYDNYIPCKNKGQIYRYNEDTLIVLFNTVGYANNRIKDLKELNITLLPYQIGDNERTYKFKESDLHIVGDIVKAKKRIKRNLTDEQREKLRVRLENARNKNK